MADSLYGYDTRLKSALKAVERSSALSRQKKRLIVRYKDEMLANGLSKGRAARLTYYLIKIGEWLPCECEDADRATMIGRV